MVMAPQPSRALSPRLSRAPGAGHASCRCSAALAPLFGKRPAPLVVSFPRAGSGGAVASCSAVPVQESSTSTAVSKKKDGANKEATAAKPKKAAALPLPEMMQEEIIPPLKAALEAEEDVSQVQLAFENNTLEGSFIKDDVPYCFWAFFPKGDLTGPKGFALSSYSNEVSTIEPFLIDEKRVTAKYVVFWVYKRLAGQGILPVWKEEEGEDHQDAK
ncbi:uncharacterized protein LOC100275810 [Zea mays]|uniref:Glyceraldehyde-3-phosphate dehydrogenase A n=3 Tax=Zea mays TaxID=4577 RepID=B4FYU2_MAIZE|nr:uncharacterized protein LOC100275810 [Zea mays]ACF87285.1 unknown [Zea mays]ACG30306.1 hypothetical protein [Zea mays]ONM25183.1 Glyceraldehyde-3-phosphate dehydrogenase A [Zea mays]|eukprot:NP_001143277.1 uncharacterized protein LOC100275810 [Zea mays]